MSIVLQGGGHKGGGGGGGGLGGGVVFGFKVCIGLGLPNGTGFFL